MNKKVAIQGYRGAFHHEALNTLWANDASLVECATFEELIESVGKGYSTHGLMAVENSLVGCILPNFLLIRRSGLHVIGEVYLKISQNLMALPGEEMKTISRVESHYMAIAQCKNFLSKYPHLTVTESIDTALSAKHIAENKLRGTAAIGSATAAEIYGLQIIAPSIEDDHENFTRFLVLSKQKQEITPSGNVKATIAFTLKHEPGSLAKILTLIAQSGANLTMLQSLPKDGHTWEYIFHADICFSSSYQAENLLTILTRILPSLWIMGIYPQGNQTVHADSLIENELNSLAL